MRAILSACAMMAVVCLLRRFGDYGMLKDFQLMPYMNVVWFILLCIAALEDFFSMAEKFSNTIRGGK